MARKIDAATVDAQAQQQVVNDEESLLALFALRGKQPREIQRRGILEVKAAFDRGAKYVVLEGPWGLGKTALAMTLARYYGRTAVCTMSELLQEQYLRDFSHLDAKLLRGRGKHRCPRAGEKATCAEGAQLYKGKDACGVEVGPSVWEGQKRWPCAYKAEKLKAFGAPVMVCNYHSFLYNTGQMELSDEKDSANRWDFLVLDEIHTLESMLLDEVGITIKTDKLPVRTEPLPGANAVVDDYFAWLKDFATELVKYQKQTPDPVEKDELDKLRRKVGFVLNRKDTERWIPERGTLDDGTVNPDWFALKPLTVKSFGHWFWRWGERVLLMSATVLDAKVLVSSLGLNPAEGEIISLPCPFPKENRPVYVANLDMRKSARDYSWPLVVQAVANILRHHSKDKGLLLTPSNELLDYIKRGLGKLDRGLAGRILVARGADRLEKYREHLAATTPTVLAAPGLWEGADLHGDHARFSIIPAVPRAPWSGQIRARAEKDGRWYNLQNYAKLIQGLGRTVRSETDTSVAYCLDRELRYEVEKRSGSLIPPWLKEAITYIDT